MLTTVRDKLIDFVIFILQMTPYPVTHNIEKSKALRQAFWHINLESLPGDYFEFGVAFGNSLQSARLASKMSVAPRLGVFSQKRKFFAFDTFDSFKSSDPDDMHPTWSGSRFSFSFESVKKRFKRHDEVVILKGDVTDLGTESEFFEFVQKSMRTDQRVAIALLDMDLKGPTTAALKFLKPMLQTGSILIFDEYFAFRGDPSLGESGALADFLATNQDIRVREFGAYGDGGRVFQVYFV